MNKTWMIIGLIVCFGLGFLAASFYYSGKSEPVTWGRAYLGSEIVGTHVKNTQGDEYGRISDFVIDTNGRVPFAVLSYGEMSVAIPFGALTYSRKGKYLVLDLTRERLDSAPAFDKSQLANRTWVEDNYKHFGQVPYWTEAALIEEGSKTMEDFPSNAPGTEYTWP
jgi:hypothetical protein